MSRFGESYSAKTSVSSDTHFVHIQFTPAPGSVEDAAQAEARSSVIRALEKRVRDLVKPNEMRAVERDGTRLYQSLYQYGKAMSVEAISEEMKKNDLSLRVTFKRPGDNSSNTVMELSPMMLDNIVKEETDELGSKMMELRVRAEATASLPRNGAMFVSFEPRKNLHYFANIDYKIEQHYDDMFRRE